MTMTTAAPTVIIGKTGSATILAATAMTGMGATTAGIAMPGRLVHESIRTAIGIGTGTGTLTGTGIEIATAAGGRGIQTEGMTAIRTDA